MKVMVFDLAMLLVVVDVCTQLIQAQPLTSLPRPSATMLWHCYPPPGWPRRAGNLSTPVTNNPCVKSFYCLECS